MSAIPVEFELALRRVTCFLTVHDRKARSMRALDAGTRMQAKFVERGHSQICAEVVSWSKNR